MGTLHLFFKDALVYFMGNLCTCSYERAGLNHNSIGTNNTYNPVHKTNDKVISVDTTFLRNKFNLVVDGKNKKFSDIY